MKKLMIALATVALAMGVQAACIDWEIGSKAIPTADGSSSTFLKQETAYLLVFDSSDAADNYYDALAKGTTKLSTVSGTAISSASSTYTSTKSSGKIDTVKGVSVTGNAGDTKYFAVVILSGSDKFIMSDTAAKQLYEAGTAFPDAVTASFKDTYFSSGTDDRTSWTTVAEDTPEPTSGVLALIGLAGLMLRRCRA